jgi:hypothetical protein
VLRNVSAQIELVGVGVPAATLTAAVGVFAVSGWLGTATSTCRCEDGRRLFEAARAARPYLDEIVPDRAAILGIQIGERPSSANISTLLAPPSA